MPHRPHDYTEASACTGKIAHTEWSDAEAAVQRIVAENIDAGTPKHSNGLGAYRCPFCGSWHVGHSLQGYKAAPSGWSAAAAVARRR